MISVTFLIFSFVWNLTVLLKAKKFFTLLNVGTNISFKTEVIVIANYQKLCLKISVLF